MAESEPHRGVEQLVARRAHNPKVVGSSPTPATTKEQSEMVALFLLPPFLKLSEKKCLQSLQETPKR